MGGNPKGANRVRKSRVPAYGLEDAPEAFYKRVRKYLLGADSSIKMAGLRLTAPSFYPLQRVLRVPLPRALAISFVVVNRGFPPWLNGMWSTDLGI